MGTWPGGASRRSKWGADLEALPNIKSVHIAETVQYRSLNRTCWARLTARPPQSPLCGPGQVLKPMRRAASPSRWS